MTSKSLPTPTPRELLDTPMDPNSAEATTIGEYLKMLLIALWREGVMFSANGPFGSADWRDEVYATLVHYGYILGTFDPWEPLERVDSIRADGMIINAIEAMSVLSGNQEERDAVRIAALCDAMCEVYEIRMSEDPPDGDKGPQKRFWKPGARLLMIRSS